MRNGLIFLFVFGIFLMWTGLGVAGEEGDHICFRRIDADQDGIVTFKEFAVHYGKDEQKFKAVDANGDGRLTHDEYHDYLGHGAADKTDKK
jgi:Ca2+-binding EF-hand superfamily protein